jgi:hypothetical protein
MKFIDVLVIAAKISNTAPRFWMKKAIVAEKR